MTARKNLRGATIALAVGLAFLAGGCSAGSDESSGGASSANVAEDSAGFSSEGGTATEPAKKTTKVDPAALTDPAASRQIRTAEMTLQVDDVAEATVKVRGIASASEGLVQKEDSTFGARPGKGSSVITLRVPVDRLDPAIERVGELGRTLDLRTSSKDVTAQVADLDSRVLSQEKSVERLRALLAEADSVRDVISIEAELSTREADLESLQAQAAAVKDKAALSTLVVTLDVPRAGAPEDDDSGFLAGLSTGWDGLKAGTVVVLTVIGVLLPIGVVLAVIGVPAYFGYRRLRRPAPGPVNP
ncbi:hypothetical protein Kisp01_45150 [Kineosporia sp. NBRC 101677]|uniref:DUF4349 domain-containing protein n=1 Tax=Kineosporia sp. NBRC 101677 TaxID=3032197 RepID=UPI0024A51E97|nr:DUF4349 domain-containing protein [Kineosporia sp. NBRC 101677]GLY17501.1 hypothetical protein Kisp01_45150 [Kineosporia sp. NBRC 101677]